MTSARANAVALLAIGFVLSFAQWIGLTVFFVWWISRPEVSFAR